MVHTFWKHETATGKCRKGHTRFSGLSFLFLSPVLEAGLRANPGVVPEALRDCGLDASPL